ncbi:MAG TPA: hypothetical protein VJ456_04590 [Acidimicrobiia bacterium]|nr:hypothetical protein [Acidimicrobiia bacterium]
MVQFSVQSTQSTQLSEGYAAFNRADGNNPNDPNWAIVAALFCDDTPDAANPDFPVWHPMDGGAAITGQQAIIAHLRGLRAAAAQATLVGVADHGNKSITLDVTLGGPEGSHACADKVEFDESGCIKVFWHCSTDTHENGHAGHPLTADGEPHEHT